MAEVANRGTGRVPNAILYPIAFLLGLAGAGYFWGLADRPPAAKFVLDMTVPPVPGISWGVDLYVNSLAGEPFRTSVKSGGRFRYEWPCHVPTVRFLRLDPVQVKGIEVAIHSLRIESNGVALHRFGPEELAAWTPVEPGRVENGAFYLKGVNSVNHIEASFSALSVPLPAWSGRLFQRLPTDWDVRLIGVVFWFGLLAVVLAASSPSGRFDGVVLTLIAAGVVAGLSLSRGIGANPIPPTNAVGFSSYAGLARGRDPYDLLVLALAPAVAALLVWRMRSKWDVVWPWMSRIRNSSFGRLRPPGMQVALLAAVCAVVFVYFLSGAEFVGTILPQQEFATGWDEGNGHLWAYLYQTGAMPYRDFWYPYGGLIAAQAPFPWGFLHERTYLSLVMILSLLSFYLLTDRSAVRAITMFAVWFGLCHADVYPAARYALLVPFVLSYIAASGRRDRFGAAHVVFWLSALAGLMGDTVVFVFAWAPVAIVLGLDLLRNPHKSRAELRSRLLRDFAVPAALVAAYVIRLAINGQLGGMLSFFLDLGMMKAYSATPANVDAWLRFSPFDSGFFMWGVPVLLGLGLYFYLTGPPEEKNKAVAVFLLGLSNLFLFYKQLMHPGRVYYLGVSITVAGFLLLIFARNARMSRIQRLAAVLTVAVILATMQASGALGAFWDRVGHPSAVWRDVKSIVHEAGNSSRYVERRWDLKNFRQHPQLLAVMDAIRPSLSGRKPNDLFTLSDEQLLYIIARKRPPYYVNFYDGSFLKAQKRTVAWLESNRPNVVVYNVTRQDVFGVPAVVRNPLVFEKVILDYVPDQRIGDYVILRPRKPMEAVDFIFWGGLLGDIPLQQLPRFSSFARFDECRSGKCADFLKVRCRTTLSHPTEAAVSIAVGSQRFHVRMLLVPEQQEYFVFLDRLWFWGGLRQAGFQPAIADHPPTVEVSLIRRAWRDDILY